MLQLISTLKSPGAARTVEALDVDATVVPFDAAQADCAAGAWARFGRGRHSAALNLGDCYSYALARVSGAQLLFKGNDFAQTDIPSAL